MSATATRPLRYAGSEIAPTFRSSFESVAAWKSCFSAMTVPEVPLGMRFFATRTGVGAGESLTLERYWTRYATRRIAARTAAAIPRINVQPRDCETLVVREVFDNLSSFAFLFIGRSADENSPALRQEALVARCVGVDRAGL